MLNLIREQAGEVEGEGGGEELVVFYFYNIIIAEI